MFLRLDRFLAKYKRPVALLRRYATGHLGLLATFTALSILGVLTESVGVFLLVPLLDSMGSNNIFANVPLLGGVSRLFDSLPADTRLIWAGSVMLIVVLLRGVLQFAQEYIGYVIPHRVDFALRKRAFQTLIGTSMQFVDALGAGTVSNAAVAHPARIGIALRFAAMLVSNLFIIAGFVLVLSIVAPYICLAAGLYVLLSTLLFRKVTTGWMRLVGRETTEANQRFGQIFYELLNGAKLIRLAGATQDVQRELDRVIGALQRARNRTVAAENMTVPFFSVVGGVLVCILVIMVGLMDSRMAGQAVGVLVLFVVLLSRILGPLSIINIARSNVVIHLDAFEEMERFFQEAEAAREPDGSVKCTGLSASIRFENVGFSYLPNQAQVISGINIEIRPGEVTAIIGSSGSGKSTLINLVTRLYRPTKGQIIIDDCPINDLEIETWWRRIAVVTQDVILTNDTIRANLCFGLHRSPSDAELRKAARMAAIDDWIDGLPEGFETLLGDRGGRLSGGQRQRIALARAFLREPEVIVLDEATSALDTLTEQTIQKEITGLAGKKTIILIAHRLSTVRRANQIIVLEAGKVIEKGTHNELVAQAGMYARMIQSQSLDRLDDEEVLGPEGPG